MRSKDLPESLIKDFNDIILSDVPPSSILQDIDSILTSCQAIVKDNGLDRLEILVTLKDGIICPMILNNDNALDYADKVWNDNLVLSYKLVIRDWVIPEDKLRLNSLSILRRLSCKYYRKRTISLIKAVEPRFNTIQERINYYFG